MSEEKKMVEEDLSRMEGTYGAEMIGKLKKMDILIIGMRGLGAETAKNLILAGPHSVTLHDDEDVVIADLGANFYLDEDQIGKGRAESTITQLAELNPNVNVELHTKDLTTDDLGKFNVVVCTSDTMSLRTLIDFNEYCRNHKGPDDEPAPIAFILGSIMGATGSIFSDFGTAHSIFDMTGEPCKTLIIDTILNQKEGSVTIDGKRHLLSNGDHIKFEEVKMEKSTDVEGDVTYKREDKVIDINQTHVVKTTKNPKRFTIGDTSELGEYNGGGVATEVKVRVTQKFKGLAQSLKEPDIIDSYMDFTKFGNAQQLHIAKLAIYSYMDKNRQTLPRLHSKEDADTVLALAKEINDTHEKFNKEPEEKTKFITVDTLNETFVRNYSMYARTELTAMATLFGGILAQEITKYTGKYTPMKGWMHFDAFELLEEKVPGDATPIQSRHDHQISIFGKKWQDEFEKKNIFVVGCGALGCEYLKMVAMSGLGTKGRVTCTDDDVIELSNLSRQFLFRRRHVTKAKSASAAEAVTAMNMELKESLDAKEIRVEPKTENVFNDEFWGNLDFVVNALDNMHARKYVDSKCVFFGKPLFESGTLGTQANSVVCVPNETPSYSEGVTAGEGAGIAKCTLRNFPSLILHCIEWAREMFDDWFMSGPEMANSFLEDPKKFFTKCSDNPMEELDNLKVCKEWIDIAKKPTFDACVRIIYEKFIRYFRNNIKDLQHLFPKEARNIEKGTKVDLGPFWHGHKRYPQAHTFDASNDEHVNFIFHGANILASVLNVKEQSLEDVKKLCAELKCDEWKYSGATVDLEEDEKDDDDDEEKKEVKVDEDDESKSKDIREYLAALDPKALTPFNAADFEKDDDTNHHIDAITAMTNLRATNYFLKPATKQHCRMISGRIIPAIATTTACITGFIGLEIYKHCKSNVKLEQRRQATINLAMNVFVVENLPDPIKKKTGIDPETVMEVVALPEGFTVWDTVEVVLPDCTLKEFVDKFESVHHNAKLTMISSDFKLIYNDSSDKEKEAAAMASKLLDLYIKAAGPIFPPDRNFVIFDSVLCETPDGDDAIVPRIKWVFKE